MESIKPSFKQNSDMNVLLNMCCISGTVLGAGGTEANKVNSVLAFTRFMYYSCGEEK